MYSIALSFQKKTKQTKIKHSTYLGAEKESEDVPI